MNTIVERQLDMVYRIACVQTRHTADAEDVTQEVFLEYIRRQPVFADIEHEKAWFIRVTTHRCRNLFKTAWRRRVALGDASDDGGAPGTSGVSPYGESRQWVTRPTAIHDDVRDAMLSLSAQDRTVIYLHYYETMDVQTMARVLNISASAVKKRLQRAREKLKLILGGDQDER